MHTSGTRALLAAAGVAALVLAGCSGGGSDEPTTTTTKATTSTTSSTTSTTEATTTTTGGGGGGGGGTTAPPTTAPPATTTTHAMGVLAPGDPCSLEEGSPDCIDPDGDGTGIYLIDGAACLSTHPDPSMCDDLDGDGIAGYPDSE